MTAAFSPRTRDSPPRVASLLGVYDANGGVSGEVAYIVGHLLGTRHCALCDITHSWRRKPEWTAMLERLGVAFELRHLNELDDAQREAVSHTGAPAVFAVGDEGLVPVLRRDDLGALGGSVDRFEAALCDRLATLDAGGDL